MCTTNPALRAALLPLVCAVLSPAAAFGQSEGSNEASTDPTPAQQLADAPAPGAWSVASTLGFQIKDGRTDTRGYNVDLIVAHSTSGRTLLRFDGELSRAEYRPPGGSYLTVDDREYASFTLIRSLKDRLGLMTVGSWQRDSPVGLGHRVMARVGPYIQLINTPRVQLMIAPLIGGGQQNNHRSGSSDGMFNLGGIQSLTWHPTNTFTVQTYFQAHQDLDEGDDYATAFNVSGTAMIASHLGLKIYYKFSAEGIHPDDRDNEQHEVGAGLSITFPSG